MHETGHSHARNDNGVTGTPANVNSALANSTESALGTRVGAIQPGARSATPRCPEAVNQIIPKLNFGVSAFDIIPTGV